MANLLLQNIIKGLRFEDLPANWNSFELEIFSKNKKLWDYQQNAVKNAIKVLWKYYEHFIDYKSHEKLELNQERKKKFYHWYKDNELKEGLDIKMDKRKRNIYNLLTDFYPLNYAKFTYDCFINRMCFWMATGSGKSLVIIKLIEILDILIKRGEIPPYDILFLTHRDDLIEQLRNHVDEFNYIHETKINLRELKEYPEVKRQHTLFGITLFYYRSDNLSDEQKEKIIDFKNYDNYGKWYIFLDEAHKGDKEDSKRQHIYSILSRNGFLFNSSATFIDERDVITCAFEFNLSSFINSGYGKHLNILKQEIRAFRDEEDYSGEEKQKIVLKSLILLTYVKIFYEKIIKIDNELYHNPLLLTLVHSVNTEEADLKLFFREIEKIGKGDIEEDVFNSALEELWEEFKYELEFLFEKDRKIKIEDKIFKGISRDDIIYHIYNSRTSGEIEILIRPSNRKELAFKLKTSDKPFALIKIGDISVWLKEELSGYEVQERFEDESYFEYLNREDSDINILMGSRSFYEGWDSNRPNVINYINIGTGTEAKKFILQSVGRGVRIEPIKNKRKRLISLYNSNEFNEILFNQIKNFVLTIETLFIFGTNRKALESVIKELEKEKKEEKGQLSLFVNEDAEKHKLLVPTYKKVESTDIKKETKSKFAISEKDFEILRKYEEYVSDDRIFIMRYNSEPRKVRLLRDRLTDKNNFKFVDKSFKNVDLLIERIFEYFDIMPEEFEGLRELSEEIRHFKNVKVDLKDISEIQNRIEVMRKYPSIVKELKSQYGKISREEYDKKKKNLENSEYYESEQKKVFIKYIANHYYVPLILSEDEKIEYISHVIKTRSETKFIDALVNYLVDSDNKFKEFDWWMFSKLDESLDNVYIPYYNPNINKISHFFPDFIFWLNKENKYIIFFVDPKGTEHIDAERKIDGYCQLFEENGKRRTFNYNGFLVNVNLKLRTDDVSKATYKYKKYWFDSIENMIE